MPTTLDRGVLIAPIEKRSITETTNGHGRPFWTEIEATVVWNVPTKEPKA
jgi:hypothetical protein